MTAALRGWKTTFHLFCLWHIFKNVLKNCASSFPDADERKRMLGLFRSAAYAATPEVRNRPNDFVRRRHYPVDVLQCRSDEWSMFSEGPTHPRPS